MVLRIIEKVICLFYGKGNSTLYLTKDGFNLSSIKALKRFVFWRFLMVRKESSIYQVLYSIFVLSTNHDSFDWVTKGLFRRERFHYCSFCWESDTIAPNYGVVNYIITWASDDYYKLLALTGHGLNVAKESSNRWCGCTPSSKYNLQRSILAPGLITGGEYPPIQNWEWHNVIHTMMYIQGVYYKWNTMSLPIKWSTIVPSLELFFCASSSAPKNVFPCASSSAPTMCATAVPQLPICSSKVLREGISIFWPDLRRSIAPG